MRPDIAPENQVQISDMELCEELARRFNALKNKGFDGRDIAMTSRALAVMAISNLGSIAIAATGVGLPVALPVLAVDAVIAANLAREALRPELRNKKLSYHELAHNFLGTKKPELPITIPGTKTDEEIKWIKTLVRIGEGRDGYTGKDAEKKIEEIRKNNPRVIESLKDILVTIHKEEEQIQRENQQMGDEDLRTASYPETVYNPLHQSEAEPSTSPAAKTNTRENLGGIPLAGGGKVVGRH